LVEPSNPGEAAIDSVSIDPLAMTGTVTNLLPEVHYDHGFIFPEQQ
jgi:hypothetical protein